MNEHVLIAGAHFMRRDGVEHENYWGRCAPESLPKVKAWFKLMCGVHDADRQLVGAYLYVRAGVFSAKPEYHKPSKWAYVLAEHVETGI